MSIKVRFIVEMSALQGIADAVRENRLELSSHLTKWPAVLAFPPGLDIPEGWVECDMQYVVGELGEPVVNMTLDDRGSRTLEEGLSQSTEQFLGALGQSEKAALERIADEYREAAAKHGPFHSAHEGLAVIREEYRELENAVFWDRKTREDGDWLDMMEDEATQLGAMALRFLVDVRKQTPGRG